jgi:hypothetical protein
VKRIRIQDRSCSPSLSYRQFAFHRLNTCTKAIHRETGLLWRWSVSLGMIRSCILRCCAVIHPRKVCVSPDNIEVWGFVTHMFLACADMRIQSTHLTYDEYMRVTKQFHFLVALEAPVSDTSPFSEYIQFQCNCCLFWWRSACQHVLLLGTYLRKNAGGFKPKPIVRKKPTPSRVGVGVKSKARAAEYCRMARPESTIAFRRGSVPTSLTQVNPKP